MKTQLVAVAIRSAAPSSGLTCGVEPLRLESSRITKIYDEVIIIFRRDKDLREPERIHVYSPDVSDNCGTFRNKIT